MKTIALLVICVLPAACTQWRVAELQPQQFSAEQSPEETRLILNDSTRVEASHPVLVGDSLVYWIDSTGASPADSARRAVPASRIRRVEVHRFDSTGTFVIFLLLGGVVGGVIVFVNGLGGD